MVRSLPPSRGFISRSLLYHINDIDSVKYNQREPLAPSLHNLDHPRATLHAWPMVFIIYGACPASKLTREIVRVPSLSTWKAGSLINIEVVLFLLSLSLSPSASHLRVDGPAYLAPDGFASFDSKSVAGVSAFSAEGDL